MYPEEEREGKLIATIRGVIKKGGIERASYLLISRPTATYSRMRCFTFPRPCKHQDRGTVDCQSRAAAKLESCMDAVPMDYKGRPTPAAIAGFKMPTGHA